MTLKPAAWKSLAIASAIVGLAIRLAIIGAGAVPSTYWDHHEYVQWGRLMLDDGLLSVYDESPPHVRQWDYADQRVVNAVREDLHPCNYPPLGVYLVYLESRVLDVLPGEYVSNTRTARLIFAVPSFVCDGLLALGCFAVVSRVASRPKAYVAGMAAFLLPPLILDSAWWTQTDAWVLAPGIWMIWAMLRAMQEPPRDSPDASSHRWRWWLLAGVLWGVALGLKTQGILFAPMWIFAALLARDRFRLVGGIVVAVVTVAVVSLPFMLTSGLLWFQRSYTGNLIDIYQQTTLKAFNIWYIDLLLTENDDATVTLLGISKDLWGKLLLFGGLVIGAILLLRGRSPSEPRTSVRADPSQRLIRFAALALLLCVILPTRVHERYIVLPLPFLICAAAAFDRKLWIPLIPFIIAASFQITALHWLYVGAENWGIIEKRTRSQYAALVETLPPEDAARLLPPEEQLAIDRKKYLRERWNSKSPYQEWTLTILELISAAGCAVVLVRVKRPNAPPQAG